MCSELQVTLIFLKSKLKLNFNKNIVDGKSPFRYYKSENLFHLVQLFKQKGADDLKMNGNLWDLLHTF